MELTSLHKGQQAQIKGIKETCPLEVRHRLLDLGFVIGASVRIQNISPLGDPIAYDIHDTLICLRKDDAFNVLIELTNKGKDEK